MKWDGYKIERYNLKSKFFHEWDNDQFFDFKNQFFRKKSIKIDKSDSWKNLKKWGAVSMNFSDNIHTSTRDYEAAIIVEFIMNENDFSFKIRFSDLWWNWNMI